MGQKPGYVIFVTVIQFKREEKSLKEMKTGFSMRATKKDLLDLR